MSAWPDQGWPSGAWPDQGWPGWWASVVGSVALHLVSRATALHLVSRATALHLWLRKGS